VGAKPSFIVKICGLSTIAHMRTAEALGAAYVGFIVETPESPRSLSRDQARLLARAARAPSVMVTTCRDWRTIVELAAIVQPAVVQLHGSGPGLVTSVRERLPNMEPWHVVSMQVGVEPDLEAASDEIASAVDAGASKIVLDSATRGRSGGTGVTMDWEAAAELVARAAGTPVLLAGGLNPGNVAEAIRRVRPAGVDVSSGVETAPNAKSHLLIRSFFEAVRQVTPG